MKLIIDNIIDYNILTEKMLFDITNLGINDLILIIKEYDNIKKFT